MHFLGSFGTYCLISCADRIYVAIFCATEKSIQKLVWKINCVKSVPPRLNAIPKHARTLAYKRHFLGHISCLSKASQNFDLAIDNLYLRRSLLTIFQITLGSTSSWASWPATSTNEPTALGSEWVPQRPHLRMWQKMTQRCLNKPWFRKSFIENNTHDYCIVWKEGMGIIPFPWVNHFNNQEMIGSS